MKDGCIQTMHEELATDIWSSNQISAPDKQTEVSAPENQTSRLRFQLQTSRQADRMRSFRQAARMQFAITWIEKKLEMRQSGIFFKLNFAIGLLFCHLALYNIGCRMLL